MPRRRRAEPSAERPALKGAHLHEDHWTLDPGVLSEIDDWLAADVRFPDKEIVQSFQRPLNVRELGDEPAADPGSLMMALMFDSSVSSFFNRDLAAAMASATEAAIGSLSAPETLKFYALESAVQRLCQCWDYLFQYLVQHCMLHNLIMPSRASTDDLVALAGWDEEVKPLKGGGVQYVLRRKPLLRALADMRAQRRKLDYVRTGKRADQFFDEMKEKYAGTAWIDEVKALARDQATRKVREIRDHMTHVAPLSGRVGVVEPLQGPTPIPGLGSQGPKWSVREVHQALVAAHSPLERAIAVTREVLFNAQLPNRREVTGRLYHVHHATCPRCGCRLAVPCPDPIVKFFGRRVCPDCGLWSEAADSDLDGSFPTTEVGFGSLVHEYLDAAEENMHRLDPEWMAEHGLSFTPDEITEDHAEP